MRLLFRRTSPMYLVLVSLVCLLALAACNGGATPTAANSLSLEQGHYTPLGGVQKNANPTASDLADLQAAENGTLGQPVLVEFYADY